MLATLACSTLAASDSNVVSVKLLIDSAKSLQNSAQSKSVNLGVNNKSSNSVQTSVVEPAKIQVQETIVLPQ